MRGRRFAFWGAVVLIVASLGAWGCGGDTATTTTSIAADTTTTSMEATATSEAPGVPIKIGVLNPTTGAQTQNGTDVNNGIKMYFDSIGNTIAGHPVELVFEDDASNPQQGLERARKLVESDKVDLLMGVVHSGVALGVAGYAAQTSTPYIVTCAGANAITGADRSPYVFRTAETNAQRNLVLGWYAGTKLGYKKAAVFSWDFVAGKEHAEAFAKSFTDAGGEVVYNVATPLPTQDFGPFLSGIDKSKIDVIYAFYASADAIRFVQQLKEFGFTPDIPVIEQGSLTEDEILPEMGDAALGIVDTTCYAPSIDNPVNTKMKELYAQVKPGSNPGWYVYQGYLGAMVAASAIESLGGDVSDKDAFLAAIQGVTLDGPGGPFAFDESGQAVLSQYLTKVEKGDDGTLVHVIFDQVPAVSQAWTP
ncbi:MAG: ABC transporter substrate-binding protein [Thermoleophilia bacterium]